MVIEHLLHLWNITCSNHSLSNRQLHRSCSPNSQVNSLLDTKQEKYSQDVSLIRTSVMSHISCVSTEKVLYSLCSVGTAQPAHTRSTCLSWSALPINGFLDQNIHTESSGGTCNTPSCCILRRMQRIALVPQYQTASQRASEWAVVGIGAIGKK